MSVEDELRNLNRRTFDLEEKPKGWRENLQQVVTHDFTIRRANPTIGVQDREQIIAHIDGQQSEERRLLSERVWADDKVGVVISMVEIASQPDTVFHNVKVFVRSDTWRCTYWQVTREKRSAAIET